MRYPFLIVILFCLGCAPKELDDCFKTGGDLVTENVTVAAFSKIRFEDDIILEIAQGDVQKVRVTTGQNLLDQVVVSVQDQTLVLQDNTSCNLVRDYGLTTIRVTTPILTEIRNSSAYDVRGIGRLSFPELVLRSDSSGGVTDSRKSGDFYLDLDCEDLIVQANGLSVFYLTGTTTHAAISFADEYPRFEGRLLAIDSLTLFHRGANAMIVNPQQSIKGRILATGDVLSVSRPAVVQVSEEFTGRLIFE